MTMKRITAAVISVILCAAQMGYLTESSAETVFGDINSDGKITSQDAKYVRNEIAKLETEKPDGITSSVWCNGDVDRNAVLDEKDAEWYDKYVEYTAGGGTAGLREFITGEPDKEGLSDYGTFNEGKNTWAVTEDFTLVLGGEGGLPDVDYNWDRCPWAMFSQTRKLKKIVIEEGVEHIGSYIFKNVSTVSEISFPSTLTSVGKWAAVNCFALKDVSLPEGVVKLDEKAFASCDSLERVSVPSTVKDYGSGTFSGNKNLSEVSLAEGLTAVGVECFKGDTALAEIALPESLESVAHKAFSNTGLTSVVIPDKVSTIGNYAFSDCAALKTVTTGKGTTAIGTGAFMNCTELESVVLNDGLATIGSAAFQNCASLKNVEIPDSVTTVGKGAFTGCSSLTELTIPENVKTFDLSDLDTCTSLRAIYIDNPDCNVTTDYTPHDAPYSNLTVYCYPGSSAEETAKFCGAKVVLMDGKTAVTAEGECGEGLEWTLNNRGVLTITGSGTMTDFDEEKQPGWSAYPDLVSTIIIDAEIPGVGKNAFSGLTKLGSVFLPDTVKYIGDGAFSGCTGITGFEMPPALETIGKGAFRECTDLYDYKLPDGLKSIGEDAFRSSSAGTVKLPESVERVGSGAFAGCGRFRTLEVTSADCVIEDGALPEGYRAVMVIAPVDSEAQKFADRNKFIFISSDDTSELACSGAAGEDIRWTLSREGALALSGTGDMFDWDCEEPGKYYMGILSPWNYCREMRRMLTPDITSVTISAGITGIGNDAFTGCGFREAMIPETIEHIGSRAFWYCFSLEKITLPDSVKKIGEGAFGQCTKLEEITILRPDCEIFDSPSTISNTVRYTNETAVSAEGVINDCICDYTGVIKGSAHSTAQVYSEKYGYTFVSNGEAQEKPFIAGDANDDGKVNVSDAVAVLQFVANRTKYPLSERGVKNADCDGTTGITGSDALVIQQIDAGIYKP